MRLMIVSSDQWLKRLRGKLLEQGIAHSEQPNVAFITEKKYSNRKNTPVFPIPRHYPPYWYPNTDIKLKSIEAALASKSWNLNPGNPSRISML